MMTSPSFEDRSWPNGGSSNVSALVVCIDLSKPGTLAGNAKGGRKPFRECFLHSVDLLGYEFANRTFPARGRLQHRGQVRCRKAHPRRVRGADVSEPDGTAARSIPIPSLPQFLSAEVDLDTRSEGDGQPRCQIRKVGGEI